MEPTLHEKKLNLSQWEKSALPRFLTTSRETAGKSCRRGLRRAIPFPPFSFRRTIPFCLTHGSLSTGVPRNAAPHRTAPHCTKAACSRVGNNSTSGIFVALEIMMAQYLAGKFSHCLRWIHSLTCKAHLHSFLS